MPLRQAGQEAFIRLQEVVATLRSEQGCPWDRKQTPSSLKKYLLEECRELAEAIDSGQEEAICEELGDVYFILSLLGAIFAGQGKFSCADALHQITGKMIRRHPHVFAGAPVGSEQELREQWERIKLDEKNSR